MPSKFYEEKTTVTRILGNKRYIHSCKDSLSSPLICLLKESKRNSKAIGNNRTNSGEQYKEIRRQLCLWPRRILYHPTSSMVRQVDALKNVIKYEYFLTTRKTKGMQ